MIKKKKRYFAGIAIVLVAMAAGLYYTSHKPTAAAKVTTTESTAEKGDLIIGFESDGTSTLPYNNLDFEVSGKLTKLYVKVGDEIKEGQVVAQIDSLDYERAYQSAKIAYDKAVLNYQLKAKTSSQSLDSQNNQIASLKINYETLLRDYEAMKAVPDAYTKSEMDAKKDASEDAKRSYELALSQYNADKQTNQDVALEKKNVESAKLQLDIAKDNLEKTVLKAPSSGKILNIGKEVGDEVEPNTDTGTLTSETKHLFVYSDSKQYQVSSYVSEQDLPAVSIGQSVKVTFDALEGNTYEGKVISIDTLPTTDSSGVVTYKVISELTSGIEEIRVGMTATVQIIEKEEKDVVIIPNKAVKMENGIQTVNVKRPDGMVEKREIKAGLTDGRNVAVSSGLNEGETVVITSEAKE